MTCCKADEDDSRCQHSKMVPIGPQKKLGRYRHPFTWAQRSACGGLPQRQVRMAEAALKSSPALEGDEHLQRCSWLHLETAVGLYWFVVLNIFKFSHGYKIFQALLFKWVTPSFVDLKSQKMNKAIRNWETDELGISAVSRTDASCGDRFDKLMEPFCVSDQGLQKVSKLGHSALFSEVSGFYLSIDRGEHEKGT